MKIENDALVGYSGFVGSNLALGHSFGALYNSENISDAFSKAFDLLVYSGVRAEKFLANNDPQADKRHIDGAIGNIKQIAPKRLVLISTVDIYADPSCVYEDSPVMQDERQAYGANRYILEEWVRNNVPDHYILRLPALFGVNLKKNFIFDMINIIPSMLKKDKLEELKTKFTSVDTFYYPDGAFYKLKNLSITERKELKAFFAENDFNALSFTDSRSSYQFYNLKNLWKDICTAAEYGIRTLNITSEPVGAGELYKSIFGTYFNNITKGSPVSYDIRSRYDSLFAGKNGYLYDKNTLINDIKDFVMRGII